MSSSRYTSEQEEFLAICKLVIDAKTSKEALQGHLMVSNMKKYDLEKYDRYLLFKIPYQERSLAFRKDSRSLEDIQSVPEPVTRLSKSESNIEHKTSKLCTII